MSELFLEGFENGTADANITTGNSNATSVLGAPTFAAGGVDGELCGDFNSTGTQVMMRWDHTAASNAWYSGYIWLDSLPASNTYLVSFFGGTNKVGDMRVNSDGTVSVRDNNSAVITSSVALTTGSWHRFALRVTPNVDMRLRLYLGANRHGTTPDYDATGNSNRDFALDNVRMGIVTAATWHVRLDRLRADDTTEPPGVPDDPPPSSLWHLVTGTGTNRQLGNPIVVTNATPQNIYVGMHNLPTGEPNWTATEALWGGTKSGIKRSFSSNIPSTAPTILSTDFGKRASWHSVKSSWTGLVAGNDDTALTSFLNSIPPDHELMLTYAHEPENDNPLNQEVARSAEWRAAQAYFYDLVKSVRPQTLVGPILMAYTYNPSSGRDPENWTPNPAKMDFFGIDAYSGYLFPMVGAPTNWVNAPTAEFVAHTAAAQELGVPIALGETAVHEDQTGIGPSRKVAWITDFFNYVKANGGIAFCYFNAYKPGDTAEPMMLDSSPEVLAAWGDILEEHQHGVAA